MTERSSPLLALPVELQALVAHHLSGPSFASLRLANLQLADGAGRYMCDRLRGLSATYGSAAFSKALPHDELASWPVRSGALAVLLPLEQWAATLSAASPLLEFWLRHELPAHYLQLLRALPATCGPCALPATWAALAARGTLQHLNIRAILRHGASGQLSHEKMRSVCEEALSLLRGKEHLTAVGEGVPSPIAAPARAALADALFTAALALHHSCAGQQQGQALVLYCQCSALLRRASDIWGDLLEPPGSLAVLSTRLALCQASAGEASAEGALQARCGGLNAAAGLLHAATTDLEALLPDIERHLGAAHPLASQTALALGGVLLRRRDAGAALAHVRRAHDTRAATLGALHEDTCKAVLWLSGVLGESQGAAAALAPFVHALRSLLSPRGEGNTSVAVDAAAVAAFAGAQHRAEFWAGFLRAAERACPPPAAEEDGDGGDGDDGGGGPPAPCAAVSPLVDEAAWLVSVISDCPHAVFWSCFVQTNGSIHLRTLVDNHLCARRSRFSGADG